MVVNAPLKSRTRNPMTVFDVGLAKDPGWPRQLRAHFHDVDLTRFHSSSVNNGGSAIAGHGTLEFKAELPGTSIPYGVGTRLWTRVGK